MAKVQVPEVWYAFQRVLRTAVTTIIGVLLTFAAVVVAMQAFVPQVLVELGKVLPASWVAWLASAFAFLVVLAGVITRIFALPGVNTFLTKFGLGSVPKKALIPQAPVGDESALAVVKPDPSVVTSIPPNPGESREEYRARVGLS